MSFSVLRCPIFLGDAFVQGRAAKTLLYTSHYFPGRQWIHGFTFQPSPLPMAAESGITYPADDIEGPDAMRIGEQYHPPSRKPCENCKERMVYPHCKIKWSCRGAQNAQELARKKKEKRAIAVDDECSLAISVMRLTRQFVMKDCAIALSVWRYDTLPV